MKKIYDLIREEVAVKIPKPVFRGFNVFSSEECKETMEFKAEKFTVTITQSKVYQVAANFDILKLFLNNSLRSIMSMLNYI